MRIKVPSGVGLVDSVRIEARGNPNSFVGCSKFVLYANLDPEVEKLAKDKAETWEESKKKAKAEKEAAEAKAKAEKKAAEAQAEKHRAAAAANAAK